MIRMIRKISMIKVHLNLKKHEYTFTLSNLIINQVIDKR